MFYRHLIIDVTIIMIIIISGGCATYRANIKADEDIIAHFSYKTETIEPRGDITLDQAISLALMRNPSLASFELEVRARDARMFQAGLYPNPEIEIEIENFGGSGPLSGFSGTETTIQFNQPIPLAGKISKEVNALTLERDVARWEYHIRKLDLINEVRKAFIDVLFAQERLKLIKEMVRLAEEFLKTATERVKVGKASPNRKNKGENCTIDKQNRT